MSITIDSDLDRDIEIQSEPCMCAQMAEYWMDFREGRRNPEIIENLKQEANPNCPFCKGTGIERVEHEVNAPKINLSNVSAAVLFEILGVDINKGEMSIPEARRAVIRAQSRSSLEKYIKPENIEYGKPREISPGVIDLKPLRFFERGLNKEQIHAYIKRFADFVHEVSQRGATKIIWG